MLSGVAAEIGEAMARGFQDVTGNLMVEGMRSLLQLGSSDLSPEKRDLMNLDIDNLLGPKRSVKDRASDIATGLRDNMKDIERSVTPTWAEELERNRKLTEQLVSQGKTTNEELRKAFGKGTSKVTMFSR